MTKEDLVERIKDNDKNNPQSYYERAKVTMSLFVEFIDSFENPYKSDLPLFPHLNEYKGFEIFRTKIKAELER